LLCSSLKISDTTDFKNQYDCITSSIAKKVRDSKKMLPILILGRGMRRSILLLENDATKQGHTIFLFYPFIKF
jgi:hypothetical protein